MSNTDFIARAFQLADSGSFSQVSEIRKALTREGFTLREIHQLAGRHFGRQLRDRIDTARSRMISADGGS